MAVETAPPVPTLPVGRRTRWDEDHPRYTWIALSDTSGPFHSGLVVVFTAAAVMSVIGAPASLLRGGRYVHGGDA